VILRLAGMACVLAGLAIIVLRRDTFARAGRNRSAGREEIRA
jgi:hypothetical protein